MPIANWKTKLSELLAKREKLRLLHNQQMKVLKGKEREDFLAQWMFASQECEKAVVYFQTNIPEEVKTEAKAIVKNAKLNLTTTDWAERATLLDAASLIFDMDSKEAEVVAKVRDTEEKAVPADLLSATEVVLNEKVKLPDDPKQDFTTFTSVDPGSIFTITSLKITGTNLPLNEDAYVYKDFGAGYFNGFTHYVDSKMTTGGIMGYWAITNDLNDINGAGLNTDWLSSFFYSTGTRAYLRGNAQNYVTVSSGTQYYMKIVRSTNSTTATLYVYSDASYSTLVGTASATVTANQTFRYLYGMVNWNTGAAGNTGSGISENMDIGDSSAKSPGTIVSDNSSGNIAWSNPGNASASDAAYATATTGSRQNTELLKATNFGFSIPTGATINGIMVEVQGKVASGSIVFPGKLVKGGVVQATAISPTLTTTEQYLQYGGSLELWSNTWTPANINASDFGVVLQGGQNMSYSINHIRITVYYTEASGGGETAAFTALSLLLTIPAITATFVAALSAAFTPLSLVATIPPITASYVQAEAASFTPLVLTLTIPEITATSVSEHTASIEPLSLLISVPAFSATYEAELAAQFTPLAIILTSPPITASYLAELEAAFTPLSLVLTIPDITVSAESGAVASFDSLSLVLTIPEITASYEAELEITFTPLSLVLTLPDITASYESELEAAFSPLSLVLTIPSFTATYEAEGLSAFTPLSLVITIPSFTATYDSELTATFTPLSLVFTIPEITATSEGAVSILKIKLDGTFETKTIKIKLGGTFVEKQLKVKVGGIF